jgi:serine/threonine protein phosphatase PrpC
MKLKKETNVQPNILSDNNQKQKIFVKSKTLHELLKQGGGQNITIDFSMLSKNGKYNNLIERAKKYQNNNKQAINEEPNDNKKEENDEKNIKNSKISKNFELLSKISKTKTTYNVMNKGNNNISVGNDMHYHKINKEKELNNKKKIDLDCLELKYDDNNNQNKYQYYSSRESSKYNNNNFNNNYNNNYAINTFNQKEKTIRINNNNNYNNNNNNNNNYLQYNSKYQNKELSMLTNSVNYGYNAPDNLIKTNNNINNIKRPLVIEKKTNNENPNTIKKAKTGFMKKKDNQAIEYETIKEHYSIKHCNCVLEYSFREDQNIDSEILMEDKCKSIENFNNDKNQMIFEIFDGHGGDEMSTYLQNNLAQIYKQNLLLNKGSIILSMKNAFHDADDEMRNNLNIEGLGSTGTLVHIRWESDNDLVIYSANVGDSRVSLISPGHIIRLSYDHRISDEKERKRIIDSGLKIIDDRIDGTLMLTRIFGNYEYKINEENKEGNANYSKGLICEPFISRINVDLTIGNQFLIIASDGIWDTLSEEEIQNIIKKNNDTQQICSLAIKNSLKKEAWDNMSIFAIKLT